MLRNAPVFNRLNSFLRSPVALLLVFAVSTMSAAACFAGQKRLTLTVIFFLMAIVSAIVATRIPRWKKNLDPRRTAAVALPSLLDIILCLR
jgi:hypothetical protein